MNSSFCARAGQHHRFSALKRGTVPSSSCQFSLQDYQVELAFNWDEDTHDAWVWHTARTVRDNTSRTQADAQRTNSHTVTREATHADCELH